MVKAVLSNGDVLLGLSQENIDRLKKGEPIAFNLKDLGLEKGKCFIVFGETEQQILKDLNIPFNG